MLNERLQGLLLVFLGCLSLVLIYFAQRNGWLQTPRPPTPPGLRPEFVPVLSPLACLLPLAGLGAIGLCLIGLQKLFAPDGWAPPRHRDWRPPERDRE